jgi:hypothetical protein
MTYLEMLRGKELLQEMHATHVFNLDAAGKAEHGRGCNYCDASPVEVEIAHATNFSRPTTDASSFYRRAQALAREFSAHEAKQATNA